jgi:hypothetical protein
MKYIGVLKRKHDTFRSGIANHFWATGNWEELTVHNGRRMNLPQKTRIEIGQLDYTLVFSHLLFQ